MGLFPYFTEIIGKILLLGFQISDFKQDFSICVQDFSLLLTPRLDRCYNIVGASLQRIIANSKPMHVCSWVKRLSGFSQWQNQ